MSENHILIVGLGKTGMSCARFLLAKGYTVVVTDSRENPPELEALKKEYPDVAVFAGGFDTAVFNAAEKIIISPGVSLDVPLVSAATKRGVEVIGDFELFAQNVNEPVVAITGSNGKSTVTILLGEMVKHAGLQAKLGGNLGTPVLDLLAETASEEVKPDFYVLEISSFQLETTFSLNPVAAVVLNISPDHMDRYRDINHYSIVKNRIYQGGGVVVVNRDDQPVISSVVDRTLAHSELTDTRSGFNDKSTVCKNRKEIGFTLNEPKEGDYGLREIAGCTWLARGEEKLFRAKDVKIKGRHNLANILAALALAEAIGLPLEKILGCLSSFAGLPHRMQWVAKSKNVNWYNDSKATNVGAAVASIDALTESADHDVILIAGGEGKDADFLPLKTVIEEKVKAVILLGKDALLIKQVLGSNVDITLVNDMLEAVTIAATLAKDGDNVLLAPACASFDMYSGYEARGLDFVKNVRRVCD